MCGAISNPYIIDSLFKWWMNFRAVTKIACHVSLFNVIMVFTLIDMWCLFLNYLCSFIDVFKSTKCIPSKWILWKAIEMHLNFSGGKDHNKNMSFLSYSQYWLHFLWVLLYWDVVFCISSGLFYVAHIHKSTLTVTCQGIEIFIKTWSTCNGHSKSIPYKVKSLLNHRNFYWLQFN